MTRKTRDNKKAHETYSANVARKHDDILKRFQELKSGTVIVKGNKGSHKVKITNDSAIEIIAHEFYMSPGSVAAILFKRR
jgi:hypothetical protein